MCISGCYILVQSEIFHNHSTTISSLWTLNEFYKVTIQELGFSALKKDLKSFLLKYSFYTVNEFVSFNRNKKVDGASTYVWMS
jgi:hypothetical protein